VERLALALHVRVRTHDQMWNVRYLPGGM
jgi:hypothetical protein